VSPSRPGGLSPDELTPVVRRHLGAGARCVSVTRAPVGNSQETWFIDVERDAARRALVLRRTAEGPLAWTDRALEFAVLRAVRARGLPVPEALWLEPAPSSIGRDYFVMERAPGAPPSRADEATRSAVARELGRALARLHALPSEDLGLPLARPPDGATAARAELARWRDRYRGRRLPVVPLLDALLAWLEANAPVGAAPVVLLWGDPGPHNLLVAGGRITALLDWELAHLGHPLDDLGAGVWACLDVLDPDLVVGAYESERAAPVDREGLRWFECLACVSRSIMLLEGVRAYEDGLTQRPAAAGLGLELLADNLERATTAAGWPAARRPGGRAVSEPPSGSAVVAAPRPGTAATARGVGRFLDEEVLAVVEDRALRRALMVASALLETTALRLEVEPALQAEREGAARALLDDLAAAGVGAKDLASAVAEVERREDLAGWRERVRRHLVDDLALTRPLTAPLRELYAPGPRRRR
jgi:aminoglycoside phosphotransferase (APT) family kinase protein